MRFSLCWCGLVLFPVMCFFREVSATMIKKFISELPETNITQPFACLLLPNDQEVFEWSEKDEVRYIREEANDEVCQLLPFTAHPYLQDLRQERARDKTTPPNNTITILLIGDSFDLQMCLGLTYIIKRPLMKANVTVCLHTPEVQVYFHRISGNIHLNSMDWIHHLRHEYFHQDFAFTGKLRPDEFIEKPQEPDFVIFSSFAWDLLLIHRSYCRDLLSDKTLTYEEQSTDYEKFDNDTSCLKISTGQHYNSHLVPWCQRGFLHNRKVHIKWAIQTLQQVFPNSMMLFRNHLAAASLFMEGSTCLGTLNQEIRHIALQECGPTTRLLDTAGLLLQGLHHLGTNTGSSTQPRDHLHYCTANQIWTHYVMNVILTLKMQNGT